MKKTPTTPSVLPPETDSEPGIQRVAWAVGLSGIAASAVGGWMGGPRVLLAVGLGALIALANLFALAFLVRRLVAPAQPKRRWAAAAALKLAVLLGAVFVLAKSGQIEVLPLIIGYAALPLGIVIGQLTAPVPVEKES